MRGAGEGFGAHIALSTWFMKLLNISWTIIIGIGSYILQTQLLIDMLTLQPAQLVVSLRDCLRLVLDWQLDFLEPFFLMKCCAGDSWFLGFFWDWFACGGCLVVFGRGGGEVIGLGRFLPPKRRGRLRLLTTDKTAHLSDLIFYNTTTIVISFSQNQLRKLLCAFGFLGL